MVETLAHDLPRIDINEGMTRTELRDQMAATLREQLAIRPEGIPLAEVEAWLEEHKASDLHLVFYGQGRHREWWRTDRSKGKLVAKEAREKSPLDGERPAASSPPLEQNPDNLITPREKLFSIAVGLGIPERAASATANYIASNYDMDNPEALWRALAETNLSPGQRKQLWRTWCSYRNLTPPTRVVEQVERAMLGTPAPASNGPRPRRLYLALDGQVVPAEEDDEAGMAWYQAFLMARDQRREAGGQPQDDGKTDLVIAMMHEQGETQRLMFDHQGTVQPVPDGRTAVLEERMAFQKREMELTMQLAQERQAAQIAAMTTQMERSNQALTETLRGLSDRMQQNSAPARGVFEQLFELLPQAKDRFLRSLMGETDQRIPLPMVKDAQGNTIAVDMGAYQTIRHMDLEEQKIGALKEFAPKFLAEIRDAIEALTRGKEETPKGGAASVPTPVEARLVCAQCKAVISYPTMMNGRPVTEVQCQRCQSVLTLAGQVKLPAAAPEGGA